MKSPLNAKNDNLLLSTNQILKEKKSSLIISLIMPCLMFMAIAFGVYAWMVNEQFKLSMSQQADAVGQSLLMQTAERASELLATEDALGINILLGSLAKNPLVADVGIYDKDGKGLYRAGLKQFTYNNKNDLYVEHLSVHRQQGLELRLRLNQQQFQLPWVVSVERAIIVAGVLLLIALIFMFRLGQKVTKPIAQLREWMREPTMPVPATERRDEIGDLARDLQAKLISAEEIEAYYAQFIEPEPEPDNNTVIQDEDALSDCNFDQDFLDEVKSAIAEPPTLDPSMSTGVNTTVADETTDEVVEPVEVPATQTAVLFIRLGGQDKLRLLSKDRLINLLQRYRDCLDQSVRLYKGEIHTLQDGSSVVLFHGRGSESNTYLTRAICCGELMRGLSHELQVELADTNTTLLLQMGIAQGTDLLGLTPQELLDNETVKIVEKLANNSRNLLLINQSIVSDEQVASLAKIRSLANPVDTFCIERVLEPHIDLLEKQLRKMRNS